MAFRKKAAVISAFSPDILVVPECECPDKLLFDLNVPKPKQTLWFGENQNKGLGIFSYSNYTFKLVETHNPKLKTIVPLEVTDGKISFVLFAIWANNPSDKGFQYVGQIWKALKRYKALLKNNQCVLVGDFNSNTIWDKPRRMGNHSTVVQVLKDLNIHSCYHQHFNFEQGKEMHPTLYMYRKNKMTYHIDYCFASVHFSDKLQSVEVGDYDFWSQYSDHVPLIVDFNL